MLRILTARTSGESDSSDLQFLLDLIDLVPEMLVSIYQVVDSFAGMQNRSVIFSSYM